MSTLDDWVADAATALHLPSESITLDLRDELLDLTRDVAHGVTRVAGPLTTYLVGLAVGAGMPPATAVETLSTLVAARDGGATDTSTPAGPDSAGKTGGPADADNTGGPA